VETHHTFRLEQLVGLIDQQQLDGVLVFSSRRHVVTFFTGYDPGFVTNWASLWVDGRGNVRLAIKFPFDLDRAKQISGLSDVICSSSPTEVMPKNVKAIGLIGGDVVVNEFPYELRQQLSENGIEVVDLRWWIAEVAETKMHTELELLIDATRVAHMALSEIQHMNLEGLSDFELASRIEAKARSLGAMRSLCLVGVGEGAGISEPSGKKIGFSAPVGLELTLYYRGVCTQINDWFVVGPKREDFTEKARLLRDIRTAIISNLKPDVSVQRVLQSAEAKLSAEGLLQYRAYDYGHGVGCDTPEFPFMVPESSRIIKENSFIVVHVGLYGDSVPPAFYGKPVIVGKRGADEVIESLPGEEIIIN